MRRFSPELSRSERLRVILLINDLHYAGVEPRGAANNVDASKPEPDVVHAALRELDSPLNSVLMVGDTPYDVQASQDAGFK
jgi:HAD superfamily hydrolase (TIGR01549 family)